MGALLRSVSPNVGTPEDGDKMVRAAPSLVATGSIADSDRNVYRLTKAAFRRPSRRIAPVNVGGFITPLFLACSPGHGPPRSWHNNAVVSVYFWRWGGAAASLHTKLGVPATRLVVV